MRLDENTYVIILCDNIRLREPQGSISSKLAKYRKEDASRREDIRQLLKKLECR